MTPTTRAEWDALPLKDTETLLALGCRKWSRQVEDDVSSPMLWLYPADWYASIPLGLTIVDIFFRARAFTAETDSDVRFGCLAFGFLRHEAKDRSDR